MIIVRVELNSANTGEVTELARMHITNDGTGTPTYGNYLVKTLTGRNKADLDRLVQRRCASVVKHPRLREHVWHLVAKSLKAMEYGT